MHVEDPVLRLACKGCRNRVENRRCAGWPDIGYRRRNMDRCTGLVAVGSEENGKGRSAGGYWVRKDQRCMDRTKRLVDGRWRNDLCRGVQGGDDR